MDIAAILARARDLAAIADDAGAQAAYIEVLRADPTHLSALTEIGNLALGGGFRSAARTAYQQAVRHHPGNAVARINLANVLRQEHDDAGARQHYEAALALAPDLPEAHQGMAWALGETDPERAEQHLKRGFTGHATVLKPYRGTGTGIPLLLLVSARGGNIPTQLWIDDRHFAITVIYTEFHAAGEPLPPHALLVNAIGDADLCPRALERAVELRARSAAPVINRPDRVQITGRAAIARRLGLIRGVVAPRIDSLSPAAILARTAELEFPLLLRRPGFHTGEHFLFVSTRADLEAAVASLANLGSAAGAAERAGRELLLISYLDARGADGMARKYRVMFVDGVLYPLHLAISRDWKVHYYTSNMADDAAFRDEERRFLEDMPGVLGPIAIQALGQICAELGLEYAGIDFALGPDGALLLFEANATMVVFPPGPEPVWDYRRRAIADVLSAATRMLVKYAQSADWPGGA
jgi:hypothetical protein